MSQNERCSSKTRARDIFRKWLNSASATPPYLDPKRSQLWRLLQKNIYNSNVNYRDDLKMTLAGHWPKTLARTTTKFSKRYWAQNPEYRTNTEPRIQNPEYRTQVHNLLCWIWYLVSIPKIKSDGVHSRSILHIDWATNDMAPRRMHEPDWATHKNEIISMARKRRTRPTIIRHLARKRNFYPR